MNGRTHIVVPEKTGPTRYGADLSRIVEKCRLVGIKSAN